MQKDLGQKRQEEPTPAGELSFSASSTARLKGLQEEIARLIGESKIDSIFDGIRELGFRLRKGDSRGTTLLVRCLDDQDPDIKRAAVHALGGSVNERQGSATGERRIALRRALPLLLQEFAQGPQRLNFTCLERLCAYCNHLGPEAKAAVPLLKELLWEADEQTKRWVVMALGLIGTAAKPAMPDLRSLWEGADPDMKSFIGQWVRHINL